jgi:hypothetical protein
MNIENQEQGNCSCMFLYAVQLWSKNEHELVLMQSSCPVKLTSMKLLYPSLFFIMHLCWQLLVYWLDQEHQQRQVKHEMSGIPCRDHSLFCFSRPHCSLLISARSSIADPSDMLVIYHTKARWCMVGVRMVALRILGSALVTPLWQII